MIVEATWDPYEATHTAIQGQTRSGKSVLLYSLLSALAGRADIEVCGLDPTGILLGPWAETGASHIAVPRPGPAASSVDYEDFLRVTSNVVAEMDRRNATELAAKGKDKLSREDFSSDLPVLVFVLEEYPGTLRGAAAQDAVEGRKASEKVAPRIEAAVNRLIAEGAKAGIRVILAGQRLSAKSLDTDARSNFGTRITMQVDNAEAVRMLHDNASYWAPIVSRFTAGQGIIERPGQGARRFKADHTSYDTYRRRTWEVPMHEDVRNARDQVLALAPGTVFDMGDIRRAGHPHRGAAREMIRDLARQGYLRTVGMDRWEVLDV